MYFPVSCFYNNYALCVRTVILFFDLQIRLQIPEHENYTVLYMKHFRIYLLYKHVLYAYIYKRPQHLSFEFIVFQRVHKIYAYENESHRVIPSLGTYILYKFIGKKFINIL